MKKIKYVIVILLIIIIGIYDVNAETLTNIKINFDEGNELKNSYLDSFVNFEIENLSDNEYKVLITKDNLNLPSSINNPDEEGLIYLFREENSNELYIYGNTYYEYASMYGDTYFTFYEYDGSSFNKVSDSILLKRPTYLSLTYRIIGQFYRDKSIDVKLNDIYNENSILNFKLGKVTDTNLLKKLDGSSPNGYEELLDYAKNDSNPTQTNSFKLNSANDNSDTIGKYQNIYDVSKIEDGSYYYGYFQIDTENGKYYALEDIALYKAENDGTLIQSNFKSQVIESNTENPNVNNTEEEIENPKTGNFEYTVIFVSLIVSSFIILYAIKKYEKFPKI